MVGQNITLKVGVRHRAKKGQAKRFIGIMDNSKPESEQYSYISSLYSKQGLKNSYELEYEGVYYDLNITALNKAIIKKTVRGPILSYEPIKEKVHG